MSPTMPTVGRRLTINTVIRRHQIEATRNRWLWEDEGERHSAALVERFSDGVRSAIPDAHITWALSWGALTDTTQRYRDIRTTIARLAHTHDDDVTFVPGGFFANLYGSRDEVAADISDALSLVRDEFQRPVHSLVAGFLSAENIARAYENDGVHVVQGNIWSQYDIDLQDGDGSIAYPYYPSKNHFLVPGRGTDRIPAVNLDGWTVDLVAARAPGHASGGSGENYNSRMGLGPIETLHRLPRAEALLELNATATAHLGDRNVARNGLGWLTLNYEISEVSRGLEIDPSIFAAWTGWLADLRYRWPDLAVPTMGAFGEEWMAAHPDNENLNYLLQQSGTGIAGSRLGDRVTWFMSSDFRLGVVDRNGSAEVFDYTSYAVDAAEPRTLGDRRWSLLGELNQKRSRPQDEPVSFRTFLEEHDWIDGTLAGRYGGRPELIELKGMR